MHAKYNELAQFVVKKVEQLKDDDQQWWCAITGGPGAGKSTLAAAVSRLCNDVYGISATVIPMDGYHYSKETLRFLDPPDAADFFPRRGSPHTFDAELFVTELSTARELKTASLPVYSRELSDPVPDGVHLKPTDRVAFFSPDAAAFFPRRGSPHTFDAELFVTELSTARELKTASLPVYSRELSDPVPDGVHLKPTDRVVFVEGNYLLLGQGGMVPGYVTESEAERWRPLLKLFDATWFVTPKEGIPEQRRRLIGRHLETWTDTKTKMYRASSPEEGAAKRTDSNDVLNAHVVETCKEFASLVIESI
eukprot:CAMPEP_0170818868 /NCGR_PEP_ID=MMETSP0733-20121128/41050_1 /TAXON_ID=186038 /ORGANISM="Fragilariopsis kerguelensis, Strain L26-C5" /LENGTH=307 /DNA_ID=CAMNT_0011179179 /DNA_START=214 /DNA_END=1138 /DNA_ORIENTATION=-